MMIGLISRAMAAGTISTLLLGAPVQADDDRRVDVEQIKEWVAQGVVRSLQSLREEHKNLFKGRLLDAELEHKGESLIYEFEILAEDGRVLEFEIDAVTGAVLKQEWEK